MESAPFEVTCRGGSLLVSEERVVRRGAVVWALWQSQITGVGCAYEEFDDLATVYLHLRDGRRFAVEEVAPRECFRLFGLLGYEAEPQPAAGIGSDAGSEVIDLGDGRHSHIIAGECGVTLERGHIVAWTLPRSELAGVNVSAGASDAVVQVVARNGPVVLLDDVSFAAALRLLLVLGAALSTPSAPVPVASTEAAQATGPLAADRPDMAASGAGPRATSAPLTPGARRATDTAVMPAGRRATNAPVTPAMPRTTNAPVTHTGVPALQPRAATAAPAATAPPLPGASPSYRQSQAPLVGAMPYYRQSQAPLVGAMPYYRQSQAPLTASADADAHLPSAFDLLESAPTARLPRLEPRAAVLRRRLSLALGTAAALLLLGALVLALYGGDFVGLGGSSFPTPTLAATPKPTPIPSGEPSATPIPSATATRAPTSTPKPAPTATRAPTSTPKPSATPSPTSTPTPTPTSSPTPSPTPSATPTSTPTP